MFCNQCKNLLEETSAILSNITAMLASEISTNNYYILYYILLFLPNIIIKIIAILFTHSTICNNLTAQSTKLWVELGGRMGSPYSRLKMHYFFQTGVIIRLNRIGISNNLN